MKAEQKKDMLAIERKLIDEGRALISGTDEVGRGPLAGPVVVATVIMPLDSPIEGVDDSKKLSAKKREELYQKIIDTAKYVRVEQVDEKRIDQINILEATREAMTNSIKNLGVMPDIALVDAVKNLPIDCEMRGIVHGDALSYSIAAASIVAKVTRDRMMKEAAQKYPQYGFERNMGYGTAEHMKALFEYGACPIHRQSFIKFLDPQVAEMRAKKKSVKMQKKGAVLNAQKGGAQDV